MQATSIQWQSVCGELDIVQKLQISDDFYLKVERSFSGEYLIQLAKDFEFIGGDVLVENTLSKAMRKAEQLLISGNWVDLLNKSGEHHA